MLAGILPAAEAPSFAQTLTADRYFDLRLDRDGNGVEDILDDWRAGRATWQDLRAEATAAADRASRLEGKAAGDDPGPLPAAQASEWSGGGLRILCLGANASGLGTALEAGQTAGELRLVHSLDRFGAVAVLATDQSGLAAFLDARPGARVMLDRDGLPALHMSRAMVGGDAVQTGFWGLGDDWSGTLAILDSGCDTAHGDLGDAPDDDVDGPAPRVGDASDWYPAASGWPLFEGFKVVGWKDVTDDFPSAQGPWDYHYHGTALASVAAGSGAVDPDYRGMAPGGRLTVVKYYDFDDTWHAWAGDFLAACAWTLDNREIQRIRTVLTAVNWDVDAGISTAMAEFVAAGIVPVAAMGNFGADGMVPGFPASLPTVLTAGAVDGQGGVAAYSGRGLSGQGKPDVLAPGGGLLASGGRIMAADNEPDDTYSGRAGTSLAAAHLAGAVYLLDEALRENGVLLPPTPEAVQRRAAVLRLTAAPVSMLENSSGTGHDPLGPQSGPDPVRGWGLLRVDAAVQALLDPLLPGRDEPDTLKAETRPVAARRLVTDPGVRYLVEAVPSGNLDVMLEIVDPAWLEGDPLGTRVIRQDQHGRGVSEFAYVTTEGAGWFMAVVKYRSGFGTVTFRLREAGDFLLQAASATLPGVATGAPNSGLVTGHEGPSLVIPSRVTVDLSVRSLNVFDAMGTFRPGWPVFVFPQPSSQGGLGQPMLADMDGQPGDEIVVASDFGYVYFFEGDGEFTEVELVINRPVSTPVGLPHPTGGMRAVAVDKAGFVRAWSHGAVLEAEVNLGHLDPRDPAVGLLGPGDEPSVVVAFADGHVAVLDADLAYRPGWPVDLDRPVAVAPVLADLDGDGRHEIVLPSVEEASGALSMRVLDGGGEPAVGDGAVVPSPGGGPWLGVSPAAVAGGYWTDDLRIVIGGLAANGYPGDQARWNLGLGNLAFDGTTTATALAGFEVAATTAEGELEVDQLLLPAPLTWNYTGGAGSEALLLANVHWNELLYGFTSIPGSATAWFRDGSVPESLAARQPVRPGGKNDPAPAHLGAMLVDAGDAYLRVQTVDDQVTIIPVAPGRSSTPFWMAARADGRNSGALAPAPQAASVLPRDTASRSLVAWPNPGSGRFRFRVDGWDGRGELGLEIYDLRGRRIRSVRGEAGETVLGWDGADTSGRPLAAGTYLAVVKGAGSEPLIRRVVLTR